MARVSVTLDSSLSSGDNGYDGTWIGEDQNSDYVYVKSDVPDVLKAIDTKGGNDYVQIAKGGLSISGGNGNDTIETYESLKNTAINGGAGNDVINLSDDSVKDLIVYKAGDGNDLVTGFNETTTLSISGASYSTVASGDDLILTVGTGKITLKGAADLETVMVSGTYDTPKSGNDDDTEDDSTSDTVTTGGNANYTVESYVYTGGDQIIHNYDGSKIVLGVLPTGMIFNEGNFALNSDTGNLFIENAYNKVIDFVTGDGEDFAKAYAATGAGIIDGRGIEGFEYIVGSSAGSDIIYAGEDGSSLWGGLDSVTDVLVGGEGVDVLVGGKYQGADVFMNASSSDVVYLSDTTLSDIVETGESNGTIAIRFNTGNVVAIQSSEAISAAVMLADGSAWRFNHATKSWQGA